MINATGGADFSFLTEPLSATLNAVWMALWALVAYHYGRASLQDWNRQGGSWSSAVPDFLSPFFWAMRSFACRMGVLRGETFCSVTPVPMPFEQGLTLRFSIFLGSLAPMILGFANLFPLQQEPRLAYTLVRSMATLISILAAGGHLFLAFRHKPDAWRRLVVWTTAVLLFGPLLVFWVRA